MLKERTDDCSVNMTLAKQNEERCSIKMSSDVVSATVNYDFVTDQ